MKLEFIPIQYEPFDFEGKNYLRLIGRTKAGKKICLVDSYEANFWVILKEEVKEARIKEIQSEIKKIEIENANRKTIIEKIELHNKRFLEKDVKALQVFITNHKDGHSVADKIDYGEVEKRREYDITITTKYIKEKKIIPFNWYEVDCNLLEKEEFGGISDAMEVECFKIEKIKKAEKQEFFQPKILAFDIETDAFELGKGHVLMISLVGKNFKKVLTWKNCTIKQDFVECFKDEEEMLEKFIKYVKEQDADILAGYFSDGFDLPYIKAAAEKNKIKLSLGLDGSQPNFARGLVPSGRIIGITHVDLFRFIETEYSQYLQSETLSLNEVASELLGEKKEDFDFSKIEKMKDNDWHQFFSYNLQDSVLTYKLAEKIWPDMYEFSTIMQEPLFDVVRDSMSAHVENYIIHSLDKFNEIAEKRPLNDEILKRRSMGKYEGAFVFQPKPGLYENLAMFDFTSMYSSVIVTYNLSLSTFSDKKQKDFLEVELDSEKKDRAYFSVKKGFFPELLEEIIKKRKQYKKEHKEKQSNLTKARSNAYKVLANAAYGYQGFFGARYYCREAAAATAALARKSILDTIEKIKKPGYEIIYSDTDSIAFLLGNKTKKETLEFLEKLNKEMPGIMELELEDFYKRGLFVSKRTTKEGAKKKYALITDENKIKIRGFETVRRDWCVLARELQNKVLYSVLSKGNEKEALTETKELIKKLKERKIDKEHIMVKTQLKKPINEYLSISPHVVAAQKMVEKGMPVNVGMIIKFFIAETREKKALVREKVKLPDEKGEYNVDYYLNNQILPAVENILEVFNINIKEIIDGSSQKKLFAFDK